MPKHGFVYITSNKNRTVLYTGASSTIRVRMYKHKKRVYPGFAKKYNCDELLYYQEFDSILQAIKRERQIKKWNREWKLELIKKDNPELIDLSKEWFNADGEFEEGK